LKFLLDENIVALIPAIQKIRETAEKQYENEFYIDVLNLEISNYSVEFCTTKEGMLLIKSAREHADALYDYSFNAKIKLKNDKYIAPFVETLKDLSFKIKAMKHFME